MGPEEKGTEPSCLGNDGGEGAGSNPRLCLDRGRQAARDRRCRPGAAGAGFFSHQDECDGGTGLVERTPVAGRCGEDGGGGAGGRDRSEERRVGKGSGSTCSTRWSPTHQKKHKRK